MKYSKRKTKLERFTEKYEINPDTGCWEWTAATNNSGYGMFDHQLVHRYAYEAMVGSIPPGLTIDHLCRVRNCVNPAHLEAVTSQVNILRGNTLAAANAAKTECPQGHPLIDENILKSKLPKRACKTCHNTQRLRESPDARERRLERQREYNRNYKARRAELLSR